MDKKTRRQFLNSAVIGSAFAGSTIVGPSGFGKLMGRHSTDSLNVADDLVRYPHEIESIVDLIEKTPREKCFDVFINRMSNGLPYRHLMSALFLAGVRNIDSAHVGGNLHTVFVVHSAHQLGLDSGIDQRLLPMFWALDYFKRVQESGRQTKLMPSFADNLPDVREPFELLENGCVEFDADRIERALITLVRTRGAADIAEPLWRLAARDFIPLGHKAIYMANAWRTLQTIGWQYAEPTLRSLAHSLASYHGEGKFSMENQCYNENWRLAKSSAPRLPANWAGKRSDTTFVKELVEIMRIGKHLEAAKLVIDRLLDGSVQVASVWDAVHLAAGEIVLRQATIGSMHGVTAANAIHYGFTQASKAETRLLLLLQGIGFVCHFIPFMEDRVTTRNQPFPKKNLFEVEPADVANDKGVAINEILDVIENAPELAASRAVGFADKFSDHRQLLQSARRLVYAKGDEAHRYKFAAAIFEDIPLVSLEWRPQMLAAATQYFCASTLSDSPVMIKAREALKRLR